PQYYRWLIENQVIYYRVVGDFTIEEIAVLDAHIISMLESSPKKPVHVVNDISSMHTMPNVRAMINLRFITHPQMGYCVVQRRNNLEYFIGNTIGKILRVNYHFVSALEEGMYFLDKIDPSLPAVTWMLARLAIVRQETL